MEPELEDAPGEVVGMASGIDGSALADRMRRVDPQVLIRCARAGCRRMARIKGMCRAHYKAEYKRRRRAAIGDQPRLCVHCGADIRGGPPTPSTLAPVQRGCDHLRRQAERRERTADGEHPTIVPSRSPPSG